MDFNRLYNAEREIARAVGIDVDEGRLIENITISLDPHAAHLTVTYLLDDREVQAAARAISKYQWERMRESAT